MAKYHYFRLNDDDSEPECTSLSNTKKPEGCAWTEHWVRGTFEGSTAIVLNSLNDSTIPQHRDNKNLVELNVKTEQNKIKSCVHKIAEEMREETEDLYIFALREYYRKSFKTAVLTNHFYYGLREN